MARDLSTIDPFQATYPYANPWNGYSPFREMAEKHLSATEEIKLIEPKQPN